MRRFIEVINDQSIIIGDWGQDSSRCRGWVEGGGESRVCEGGHGGGGGGGWVGLAMVGGGGGVLGWEGGG